MNVNRLRASFNPLPCVYHTAGILWSARRGAWGARTERATAAATVGKGAARRGAQGARTLGATAATAVGPGGEGRKGEGATIP